MESSEDKGGGTAALPKSMSRSNMEKSESLKRRLKESVRQHQQAGMPHTLGGMTRYSVRLPSLVGKPEQFQALVSKLLIDNNMLQDLEDAHVINFCRTIQKLYPLKTAGDGNCLLHAVSLAIWGIHDKAMLLRRLVYIALVEDEMTQNFRRRWKRERKRLNESVPEGLDLSSTEWTSEWDLVVRAAEDLKRLGQTSPRPTPGQLPLEALEEIHIFVLANIIQRPIIVLADQIVRSLRGSILGPNNFGGVYLPLLWAPGDCFKAPVVLGYHRGHFTPLVNMELINLNPEQMKTQLVGEYVVPVVSKDMESLHIHFLNTSEESKASRLLQQYLRVTETNWTRGDGLSLLLTAKMEHTQISPEYDLMTEYVRSLEKKFMSRKSNETSSPTTTGVQNVNESTSEVSGNFYLSHTKQSVSVPVPSEHSMANIEELSNVSNPSTQVKEERKKSPLRPQKHRPGAKRCITERCDFFGAIEYGGYCSKCYLETTKHHTSQVQRPQEGQGSEYVPSLAEENCAHQFCHNMASKNTYPYCHEHATSHDRRISAHKGSRRERENTHVASSYEPSLTSSKCSHYGCKNVASVHTFPYCHEHKDDKTGSRHTREHTSFFQGPTSATPYQCAHYGCLNQSSVHTHPYCHEHVGQTVRLTSEPVVPVLSTGVAGARQVYEPTITEFRCRHPKCSNMASVNTFPHCHEHFKMTMPTAKGHHHSGTLPIFESQEGGEIESVQPRSRSLESNVGGASKRCPERGCRFFGPPAFDFYCSEHYVMRKNKPNRTPKTPSLAVCLTPYCTNKASPKYGGLCSGCYAREDLSELLISAEKEPQNTDPIVEPTYCAENVLSQRQNDQPPSHSKISIEMARCVAPNCENRANPETRLCDECYNFLSQKPNLKSEGNRPTEPEVAEDCAVVASSLCTEPSLMPCVNQPRCGNVGETRYKYFCRPCFDSLKHLEHAAAGHMMFNGKLKVSANTGGIVSGTIVNGGGSGLSTAAHRPTTGQQPPHDHPGDTLSSGDGGEGFQALRRLENNVRASRRRCRNRPCSNFGNPVKQGYCNICQQH